jgi:hypothetical protein
VDEPLKQGDRVRITEASSWARGVSGTIAPPPGLLLEGLTLLEGDTEGWNGVQRQALVDGERVTSYWVQFDRPQRDEDGAEPLEGGEFSSAVLSRLGEG